MISRNIFPRFVPLFPAFPAFPCVSVNRWYNFRTGDQFASRWRKIAKNLPQDLIHYTTRKAFAVEFEVLRSSVVQAACSSSLLRFHFQRRSLSCRSKLIQVARWPSGLPREFGCPLWLRRSAMGKRKSGGCRFSKFFVWATCQNLFPVTSKHSSCAKNQTQRQMHLSHPCALMSLLYGNQ